MVEKHGLRTLKIAQLKLPGDMETRRRNPDVIKLGKSFASTGGSPMAPPVVEKGTWKLIAGCDRIAACMNEDIKAVECLVVSGTSGEMEELTLIENVMRRHATDERARGIARLVEIHTARDAEESFPDVEEPVAESEEVEETPAPPKEKRKAKSKVYKKVAELTGSTPAAVKQAAHRERKKTAEKAAAPEKPALVIDDLGLEVPEKIKTDVAVEHDGLTLLHRKLVLLQGDLTRLEGEAGHQFQNIKSSLHDAAVATKAAIPESACVWCKDPDGTGGRRKDCLGCRGRGWLTAGEMKAVTDVRLLEKGARAGVFRAGRWVPLAEA